jgi:hypothetical protein
MGILIKYINCMLEYLLMRDFNRVSTYLGSNGGC